MVNFVSFDIEDWFHILDFPPTKNPNSWVVLKKRVNIGLDTILEVLDNNNTKATFFCLGWICEKYPDLIKKIDKLGHHIGSHSYYHQLLYELTKQEFIKDAINSKKIFGGLYWKRS